MALAESDEVADSSERPADQALDLLVLPLCLPRAASRLMRSREEPGRSEYSAVTQPRPLPRIQRGTSASTDAVQSTTVLPIETSDEPAANSVKSLWNSTERSWSGRRPSRRCGVTLTIAEG